MRHPTLSDTRMFMMHAHQQQLDKSGAPYWQHPYRVMLRLLPVGIEITLHAALLHDVVEDTVYGLEDLAAMEYGLQVLAAVDLVSRYKDGRDRDRSYLEWINGIGESGNMAAILVKYADLLDNNAPGRLATLPSEMRGIEARQNKALEMLAPRIPDDIRLRIHVGDLAINHDISRARATGPVLCGSDGNWHTSVP